MKRHIASAIAFVLSVSLLAGCGGKTPQATTADTKPAQVKPVTITFARPKDQTPANAKILEAFAQKYPNIKVNLLEMPGKNDTIHDDYVTKLSSGDTSIDVFSMDIVWPPEFSASKWLLPLDEYYPAAEQEKFLKGPLAGNKLNGKLYSVPWYTDAGLLYYRKDILEKNGKQPPKTWDDIVKLSKELVGKDGIDMGITFQADQFEGLVCTILELMWSNGGDVLNGDKVVINTPNNVEAIKFARSLIEQGIAPPGVTTYKTAESLRPFLEGKSLFMRNWPYAWAEVQGSAESKVKDKVGVVALPVGPKGTKSAPSLGGWNLGVNANVPADRKEAAITFLKFAAGPEGQKINAVAGSRLPTLDSLYGDADILKVNPHWKEFYGGFVSAKPRPVTPLYPRISDAMQINVHKALTGGLSAEDAAKNMQDAIEKILKK